jgi:putative drug exporter of the RND superfamily
LPGLRYRGHHLADDRCGPREVTVGEVLGRSVHQLAERNEERGRQFQRPWLHVQGDPSPIRKVPGAADMPRGLQAVHERGRCRGAQSQAPRRVLGVGIGVLAVLAVGLVNTNVGLAPTEQFRTEVESVTAQDALARHFPAGASQPVTVISRSAALEAVVQATRQVEGVSSVASPERSDDGALGKFTVQLTGGSGTPEADRTVTRLRTALAAVPDADALVGGAPAADLDQRDGSLRDTLVVAPLVLAAVLAVLILLLRSLLAPVLLLLTVIASYAASLGAATVVLDTAFGLPGLDASVPLLSFLFLFALGVDYNIFLVTRAREETAIRGDTVTGMQRALAATGGVITSAGVLLAAVFAVLGVLPAIVLTQIGVIVGIGVLLDTLLVRTIIVPALASLLAERFWWPAHPSRSGTPPPADPATPALAHVGPVADQ